MAGVNSVEALCAAAIRQGASALALTDVNGLYGAIRFIQAARDVGLRPLLGAELTHCSHRTVALARTAAGYANYRTPIRGLYLCGSAAHPGGGVMGACGSNAAREIMRDAGRRR